jgi:hypothetical protein
MTIEGAVSEWWTYSLSNFLLFSPRTYYRLFELTNADVWPLHIVTLALGVGMAFLVWRPRAWSGRAIAAILATLWLFVAWAYLLERYDTINWAARYFAIAFVLQAALLVWSGVLRNRLIFEVGDIVARTGLALFLYALALHPLIAPLTGRPVTQAEIFGLAPDPTAIATLGILLAAERPRLHLFVIPLLWCLITGLTLWTMESSEAALAPLLGLLAATIGLSKALAARRKMR